MNTETGAAERHAFESGPSGDEATQPLKRTRVLLRWLGINHIQQDTSLERFEEDLESMLDEGYELLSASYGNRTLVAILRLPDNADFTKS